MPHIRQLPYRHVPTRSVPRGSHPTGPPTPSAWSQHGDTPQDIPPACAPSPVVPSTRSRPHLSPLPAPRSQLLSHESRTVVSAVLFSTGVWLSAVLLFRQTMRLLLSYHGWMFEPHGKMSRSTKIWVVRATCASNVRALHGGPWGRLWGGGRVGTPGTPLPLTPSLCAGPAGADEGAVGPQAPALQLPDLAAQAARAPRGGHHPQGKG